MKINFLFSPMAPLPVNMRWFTDTWRSAATLFCCWAVFLPVAIIHSWHLSLAMFQEVNMAEFFGESKSKMMLVVVQKAYEDVNRNVMMSSSSVLFNRLSRCIAFSSSVHYDALEEDKLSYISKSLRLPSILILRTCTTGALSEPTFILFRTEKSRLL